MVDWLGRKASAGGSLRAIEVAPGLVPGAFSSPKFGIDLTELFSIKSEGFSLDGEEKLELELGLGCRSC